MVLTGSYLRALDEKQRVALPKKFREYWEQRKETSLVVAPGNEGALNLYGEPTFAKLAERLAERAELGREAQASARAYRRVLYSQAELVEPDQQGRVLLPARLATAAGLAREVMLIGVDDHVEIWPPDRWQAYLDLNQARFDDLAAAASRAGE